jgi:lysophosphatidylcholine acyltransferase/lyso-PAF acetyltransferase
VKPVVVSYPAKNFSPTWESIGGLTHIFRVLTQIQNHVEVTWLPVYYPSEEEKKDPKLYANNVRKVLSKALQIPMVESSFADKVDYHVAIGHRKPVTTNAAPTNEVKKDN